VAFVHPKSSGGVLLELIQATPEIIANFDRHVTMD
jgi:hypothetical protein